MKSSISKGLEKLSIVELVVCGSAQVNLSSLSRAILLLTKAASKYFTKRGSPCSGL